MSFYVAQLIDIPRLSTFIRCSKRVPLKKVSLYLLLATWCRVISRLVNLVNNTMSIMLFWTLSFYCLIRCINIGCTFFFTYFKNLLIRPFTKLQSSPVNYLRNGNKCWKNEICLHTKKHFQIHIWRIGKPNA